MSPSLESRENRELATELKFVVPKSVGEEIRSWARETMQADPHGREANGDEYLITSLYFDTRDFSVYHRRGSYGRSKFRIRRYNQGDLVFLERKLKTRGLVSKRRCLVPIADLAHIQESNNGEGWPGKWYRDRLELRGLLPQCQISYHRTARLAMAAHGPVRLTVDDRAVAIASCETCFQNDEQGLSLLPEDSIIELKYRSEVPGLFKDLIERFSLTPKSFSKYRTAALALNLVEGRVAVATANEPLTEYA